MNSESKTIGAPWWREMLTRRQANERLATLGAMTMLLASAGITAGCESEEDEDEVQRDALELQQQQGWNIGSTEKALVFPDKTNADSLGTLGWSSYLDASTLLKAYQPKNSAWQPFVVPTLVQALSQPTLRSQLAPVYSQAMREAYSRGLGMREILLKSQNVDNMTLVVDLPGPESIAYGAALSDVADVILTFDNWPHPLGVVKSHLTLAALLYYAQEVSQKTEKRPAAAPAVVILDSSRLSPYSDEDSQFDNRYIAKLPTAENLSTLKISSVLYNVPNEARTAELDDLNDDFAIYKEKGINVAMMPLSHFQPSAQTATAQDTSGLYRVQKPTEIPATTPTTTVYHYGGGPSLLPYFFLYYPLLLRPSFPTPLPSRLPPTSLPRPTYQPVRRPTVFSSSTVGGRGGIGKQRPTGFGRVSTRVSSDGRTITGIRSGRSGSYGRSSGRFSS
jgi:hypothetical protein